MRFLLCLSTLGLHLVTAAYAQTSASQQRDAPASASQAAPWLQMLPGRRGLEPRPQSPEKSGLTDINSATARELIGLTGIGRTRADDIIKGRPYYRKGDLLKRKILPPEVYNRIVDTIVARQK